jgi:hypothetical protein
LAFGFPRSLFFAAKTKTRYAQTARSLFFAEKNFLGCFAIGKNKAFNRARVSVLIILFNLLSVKNEPNADLFLPYTSVQNNAQTPTL